MESSSGSVVQPVRTLLERSRYEWNICSFFQLFWGVHTREKQPTTRALWRLFAGVLLRSSVRHVPTVQEAIPHRMYCSRTTLHNSFSVNSSQGLWFGAAESTAPLQQ